MCRNSKYKVASDGHVDEKLDPDRQHDVHLTPQDRADVLTTFINSFRQRHLSSTKILNMDQ